MMAPAAVIHRFRRFVHSLTFGGRLCALFLPFAVVPALQAQTPLDQAQAPRLGIKTNLPYWATVTPNLGAEFRLARHWTVEAEVGLNPWKNTRDDGSHGKELRHLRVHPELRYWFCEAWYKHFIGIHAPWVVYNFSDISWLNADNRRLQGRAYGVGLSYGYAFPLSKHWNMEATVGGGWLHLKHDVYPCTSCGSVREKVRKNYFGLTQAGLNLTYIF